MATRRLRSPSLALSIIWRADSSLLAVVFADGTVRLFVVRRRTEGGTGGAGGIDGAGGSDGAAAGGAGRGGASDDSGSGGNGMSTPGNVHDGGAHGTHGTHGTHGGGDGGGQDNHSSLSSAPPEWVVDTQSSASRDVSLDRLDLVETAVLAPMVALQSRDGVGSHTVLCAVAAHHHILLGTSASELVPVQWSGGGATGARGAAGVKGSTATIDCTERVIRRWHVDRTRRREAAAAAGEMIPLDEEPGVGGGIVDLTHCRRLSVVGFVFGNGAAAVANTYTNPKEQDDGRMLIEHGATVIRIDESLGLAAVGASSSIY